MKNITLSPNKFYAEPNPTNEFFQAVFFTKKTESGDIVLMYQGSLPLPHYSSRNHDGRGLEGLEEITEIDFRRLTK